MLTDAERFLAYSYAYLLEAAFTRNRYVRAEALQLSELYYKMSLAYS